MRKRHNPGQCRIDKYQTRPAPSLPAMPERSAAKLLEWLASARGAYLDTLEYIARDDEHAARQVAQRVDKSLAAIQTMPSIGTPTAAPGVRRYPIPNTGHVVNYKVTGTRIVSEMVSAARKIARRSTGCTIFAS